MVEIAFVPSSNHSLPICITPVIYCHHSCCSVALSIKKASVEVYGLGEPLASALHTLVCPIWFRWIKIGSLPRLLALNSPEELYSLLLRLIVMYFFESGERLWDEV